MADPNVDPNAAVVRTSGIGHRGYGDGDGMGLALLPGISMPGQEEDLAVVKPGETGGLIESADFDQDNDRVAWHIKKIRERQANLDAADQLAKSLADKIVTAATGEGGKSLGPAPDEEALKKPLAFGPSFVDIAVRHYRDTPAPAPFLPHLSLRLSLGLSAAVGAVAPRRLALARNVPGVYEQLRHHLPHPRVHGIDHLRAWFRVHGVYDPGARFDREL